MKFCENFHYFHVDCTLPHKVCWIPADSSRFWQTQIPDFVGVTWAKFACPVWGESAGIKWKSPDSTGICGIQPDKVQWTCPADSSRFHMTSLYNN